MASKLNLNSISLEELKAKVNALPEAGTDLPELDNPATSADALSGKEFIDGDGNKITGTIETKTSSNLTASGATVTVPAGYYASQATKSVTTATQATPSVSIDANGKITATSTQSAGYVSAGTKTGTKQMTVQAAKTITPTKSSQTAVAKNVYTTGVVTVGAIPDQYQDITTPLSDLNAANGGTAATTISAAVDNTEAHASSQEALIAQIAEALEGKAGGSGEDVSTETTEYTRQLNELESTIDSLPDASGGSSVETCTVLISNYESSFSYVTCDEEKNISTIFDGMAEWNKEATEFIVVKGTFMHFKVGSSYIFNCTDGATVGYTGSWGTLVYISPTAPDAITIDYYFD